MVLFEFSPNSIISEYVRTYRIVQFQFDSNYTPVCKPYPPRPEHCLTFYPRDRESVEFSESGKKTGNLDTVLFGQLTETTNRFVGKDFLLFQIVFNPGGLYRLIGVPSFEITNEYLDAKNFFIDEIKFVNEKLNACKNYSQMIMVIENFLLMQIKRKSFPIHRLDAISSLLIGNSSQKNVDWLAKESCLSLRQFERKFSERMGVSPKYFSKVARFENAFRMKNQFPQKDWLSIAIHCGYHDYQHLARDYKSMTLCSPPEFHQQDLSAPERVFGDADTY